jgi:hypothetical protein
MMLVIFYGAQMASASGLTFFQASKLPFQCSFFFLSVGFLMKIIKFFSAAPTCVLCCSMIRFFIFYFLFLLQNTLNCLDKVSFMMNLRWKERKRALSSFT